jgi:hypothetical protein
MCNFHGFVTTETGTNVTEHPQKHSKGVTPDGGQVLSITVIPFTAISESDNRRHLL